MEQNASLVEPCTGAYDARHIRSVLRYLHSKATGLDAVGRAALLERASRLPGLGGCFIEHRGGFAFRPDGGQVMAIGRRGPSAYDPTVQGTPRSTGVLWHSGITATEVLPQCKAPELSQKPIRRAFHPHSPKSPHARPLWPGLCQGGAQPKNPQEP